MPSILGYNRSKTTPGTKEVRSQMQKSGFSGKEIKTDYEKDKAAKEAQAKKDAEKAAADKAAADKEKASNVNPGQVKTLLGILSPFMAQSQKSKEEEAKRRKAAGLKP